MKMMTQSLQLKKNYDKYIDKSIRDIIFLLNLKGYITASSCSGHEFKKIGDLYPDYQERYLCIHHQLGTLIKELPSQEGYIMFDKYSDGKKIYQLIKKCKEIASYFSYDVFLDKIHHKKNFIIRLNCKYMYQKDIDFIWNYTRKYLVGILFNIGSNI